MKHEWIYALFRLKKSRFTRILKLFSIFTFIGILGASANGYSQEQIVSFDLHQCNVNKLFKEIRKQTGIRFVYNEEHVATFPVFDIKAEKRQLKEVLDEVFNNSNLECLFQDDVIFLVIRKTPATQAKDSTRLIKGIVRDERDFPLPGATVTIKGSTIGVATDKDGKFQINISRDSVTLVFSFIGMQTKEVKIKPYVANVKEEDLKVILKESQIAIEDVIVTGYSNIRKSSFTGSSTQVKREDLLKVSPGNVIDALQVFDPSLRMIKNNLMGSDPNTLPEFYIRGRSGLAGVKQLDQLETSDVSQYALTNNPNTPVFIMDGYEVSMEKVYDLDPNRIESINILKDAAATAIYGSRASNGVIVIETVAPKPGELRISYNFTGSITAPDLSGYNLMNAKQKLESEVAAGLLDEVDPKKPGDLSYSSRLNDYRTKQNNILQGIDTYWLSQPLQTEFNHKHSLYLEGGVESIRFGFNLRYENQKGVMIGSYRNRLGGDFKIDYRIRGFQITNQVGLDVMKSKVSPYGSFADYTKQMPYYSPKDPVTGKYVKTLPKGWGSDINAPQNPLYDTETDSFEKTSYNEFTDNLLINWYFLRNFQLKGQLALTYKQEEGKKFQDPNSSIYDEWNKPLFEKGELFITNTNTLSWNTNILLTYNNSVKNHNMNFSLGLNAKEDKIDYERSWFRGFPSGKLSDQKYAKEIVENPSLQDNHTRLFGMFLTTNYTYNDIYLFDASVRFDGSSEFGTKKRFATFWSGGAGINIHNYKFMEAIPYISMLRLKSNYGQTGKVNYPPYAARHTYEVMLDGWHTTGIGASLYYMGNNNLKWEKTNTINIGADIGFWDRLTIEFSWYNKLTKDLISDVTLPSSAGFTTYKENLGEVRNRGYEIDVNLAILQDKTWNLNVFFRAAHNKNEILKISNSLKAYNDRVDSYFSEYWEWIDTRQESQDKFSKPIMKYEEGGSLTSIFGMKSLGIAPANGQELYEYRDGTVSYQWATAQQVIIGNEEPKLQGSFGLNARYKNFTLYTTFLFETGADAYNQTLVDNVENVDFWSRNADKRIMTQRWQKPGDVTTLKSIKDRFRITRPTSRFIQKNNTLTFNSLSVGYDFDAHLIQRIGLSMLRLQFNMKDIAVMSSIKQERGLDYPFARTFNFTLNASF